MLPKLIAYYLPQYHPIPENDAWWGKGFTEWTNVAKAKPLFRGHYQPRLPADLGFYDLRVPEVRERQAELAREHGIYGFCYYHYWFGNGKQLLERPFGEVLESGKPDFPFMLCWANETWQGVWHGASKGKVLIEQQYPGKEDYVKHFNYLVKAFSDPRYITIDNRPVFQVYRPLDIPDLSRFVDAFRELAHKAGLPGLYLIGARCPKNWNPLADGFDGAVSNNFAHLKYETGYMLIKNSDSLLGRLDRKLRNDVVGKLMAQDNPRIIEYKQAVSFLSKWPAVDFDYYPLIVSDWDNSPRAGTNSMIFKNFSPHLWGVYLKLACDYVLQNIADKPFIFVKSWNEWAEGNYLEPDLRYNTTLLKTVKKALRSYNNDL